MQDGSAALCKPNFSGAGRARRLRIGWSLVAASFAVAVSTFVTAAPWYVRLVVFLPAAGAAVSLLQVSRHTCVAHAALGTFEHDDFTTTQQSAEDAAASRRVARTIYRDGLLIGVSCALLSAASALL